MGVPGDLLEERPVRGIAGERRVRAAFPAGAFEIEERLDPG